MDDPAGEGGGIMMRLCRILLLLLLVAPPSAWAQPYREAPMFAEPVRAGELPPVDQRLPDEPVVVEPVRTLGEYGGTWRRLAQTPEDMLLNTRLGYEPLVRWDRDGRQVVPGVAQSWQVNDDATEFVFHLRRGMKWSDGEPLTSEDFAFTHQYIEKDERVLLPEPSTWQRIDGELMELETTDPYTVVIRFAEPYGMFLEMLAYRGSQRSMVSPAHYLKQFHAAFVDERKLQREAKQQSYADWGARFIEMMNLERNPDLPTINPYICQVPLPAPRARAVRNPYYWKVDPRGRQLPYIDQIAYTTVFDQTVLNMRAMDGDVDFQARHIQEQYYTLFMESRESASDPRNHYRVMTELAPGAMCVYVNQHSRDEKLRPLLQDRRFRVALSVAINREELIALCFHGLAVPSNGVCAPDDTYYVEGIDSIHTDFDPDRANRLLDDVGLERGEDGMRRMPDGSRFRQILHVFPNESPDVWQLVIDYWREVGLDFIVKYEDATLSGMQARNANSDFWAYGTGPLHWELDGHWRAPITSYSAFAPLYGRYHESGGQGGVKPTPEFQQLLDWHEQMRATASLDRRLEIGHKMLEQWAEQCYVVGICRRTGIFIVSKRFRNVPDYLTTDYRLMSPGYIGIEQFWIDDPKP